MEGKLKDVRFRLSAQRREVEQTNQTRETRIAEITLLQQQLQVSSCLLPNQKVCLCKWEGQWEPCVVVIFDKFVMLTPYNCAGLAAVAGEVNS